MSGNEDDGRGKIFSNSVVSEDDVSFQAEVGICISILETNDTTREMGTGYKQLLDPGQVLQLRGTCPTQR